jgi:hypothetical protein
MLLFKSASVKKRRGGCRRPSICPEFKSRKTFRFGKRKQHYVKVSIETDLISVAINLILAVATVVAVFYAYKTVKSNQKSLEAQFLYDLLKEYSAQDMGEHLRILRNFKGVHPDAGKAYKEQYGMNSGLDSARRDVSHYYQRISRLREAGYVSDLFVKTVVTSDNATFLQQVIIPIEKAHAEATGTQPFNEKVFDCIFKVVRPTEALAVRSN